MTEGHWKTQSRQSAKRSLQSSEFGPLQPAGECVRPPLLRVGGHTRSREMGWKDPIRTRGQTLWYSRYICIYFVLENIDQSHRMEILTRAELVSKY
jgi:hypothetical protein